MFNPSYFERLIEAANVMVRHPEYPNKAQVIDECRHDVADLNRAGRITADEAEVLLEILGNGLAPAGSAARDGRPTERSRLDHAGRGDHKAAARASLPY